MANYLDKLVTISNTVETLEEKLFQAETQACDLCKQAYDKGESQLSVAEYLKKKGAGVRKLKGGGLSKAWSLKTCQNNVSKWWPVAGKKKSPTPKLGKNGKPIAPKKPAKPTTEKVANTVYTALKAKHNGQTKRVLITICKIAGITAADLK